MITLTEELFASLVIGSKTYIIVDEETKCAIENSDYGKEHMVCENDSDTVGWAGPALGQVHTVGAGLYRLWNRSEWKLVGNLAKERAADRDRKCAKADALVAEKVAADAKAIEDLKDTLRKQGVKEEIITNFFASMKPDEIRSMLGLT
jgi:hypothetical protein